jgi:chemotaxis protein CheY-P-specific phosphatase CheC
MREGLLTEIANMLVSAFITEIAEQLELEIYSNVPQLTMASNFNEELVISDKSQLLASIELTAKDSDISMRFLLQFPEVFFTFL